MKIPSVFLIAVLALSGISDADGARAATGPTSTSRVLAIASLQRSHSSPARVTAWLRRQSVVAWAATGPDRQTVDVFFRDGTQAAILPASERYTVARPLLPLAHVHVPVRVPAPQAAVWEPFATELGLGPSAGDVEVQQLQAAGFSVDQKYDTAVTVEQLASLFQYNVVYMHTHSGVSASGDGVLASGQLANGDPAVAPYLQDGSVITVGVAGTSQQYYGITGKFIATHEGSFPANALLFLNGCALLRASSFWQALHAQGVATLISWDQNAAAKDDFLSAAAVFNVLGTGQTVAAAITTVRAAGYGASSDKGVPATLGFLGDGSLTLRAVASGGAGNPPPPATTPTGPPVATATDTAVPASSATSVPTTTSTSTPVPTHPPVPALVSLEGLVKPGATQRVSISNLVPGTVVQARVTFPNGEVVERALNSDANGDALFTFIQPGNVLTRQDQTAKVAVTGETASGTATTTRTYTIGYGTVDLVASPPSFTVGHRGAILVHTRRHARVQLVLAIAGRTVKRLHGTTGLHGWLKSYFTVKQASHRGQRLSVHATVQLDGKSFNAVTYIPLV